MVPIAQRKQQLRRQGPQQHSPAVPPGVPDGQACLSLPQAGDRSAAKPEAGSTCLHELFEEQVEHTPHAVAVVCEGEQLTYAQLNRRANQLAHYLQSLGVGPEVLAGICMERSLDMVVGLLGILKAGGAYVPLDPAYPRERIAFVLADAQAPLLLTQEPLAAILPDRQGQTVCLDSHWAAIAAESDRNLEGGAQPDHLAYLIYTSGSTGKPKGVQIPHRALVNFLSSMLMEPGLSAHDALLAVTTLSFDIAGLELFLPLTAGARVVIAPRAVTMEGARLLQLLHDSCATVMQATPVTWRLLLDAGWPENLRAKILCGGEAMSRELAQQLLSRSTSLWNMYGPTETTIWSTIARVEAGEGPVPLGHPIANTDIHLLDPKGEQVPFGEPGELCIGGVGLARGYRNRPELTAERFIPHPFSREPGARLYRTGDLARYRTDGSLEFLGRVDHQVKLRGFRIELGEIEASLRRHPAIREAVSLLREDSPGVKRLVAYYVSEPSQTPGARELRPFLQEKLPEHMVPAIFVPLDVLPLTPNGKVDRKALPAPDPVRPELPHTYVAPQGPIETQLAQIWEELLGIQPIGRTDSFFDLGGHSLVAARLFAQIENIWARKLPLSILIQASTIEQLARFLQQENATAWNSLVAIQPSGSRPPLFCLPGVGGNVLSFYDLARHLGPDQPVFGLQSHGLGGRPANRISVDDMAAHYVEELRAVQPEGPYFLAGFSFGGTVAFEMAQQLRAQGQKIALLAMIDAGGPGYPRYRPAIQRAPQEIADFMRAQPAEISEFVQARAINTWRKIQTAVWRMAYQYSRSFGVPLPRPFRNVEMVNLQAMRGYLPRVYPGRLVIFRAAEQPPGCYPDPYLGWGGLAAEGLEVHEVPGTHHTVIREPQIRILAERLLVCLQSAQSAGTA